MLLATPFRITPLRLTGSLAACARLVEAFVYVLGRNRDVATA